MNDTAKIHILLAEDEETDAMFARKAFEKINPSVVLSLARDGQEVLDFLESCNTDPAKIRPNLIILDIKMPRKDGHEALAEIKQREEWRDIPVVMLSGSKSPEGIARSYRGHACAHVPKPNGFTEMMQMVQAIDAFWLKIASLPEN